MIQALTKKTLTWVGLDDSQVWPTLGTTDEVVTSSELGSSHTTHCPFGWTNKSSSPTHVRLFKRSELFCSVPNRVLFTLYRLWVGE